MSNILPRNDGSSVSMYVNNAYGDKIIEHGKSVEELGTEPIAKETVYYKSGESVTMEKYTQAQLAPGAMDALASAEAARKAAKAQEIDNAVTADSKTRKFDKPPIGPQISDSRTLNKSVECEV